ncbi:MAG: hypothetical protein M0Z69_02840 [Actinomycetota bacterium]|nr:hypothetical protein [Actinomycetota bacterium]
MTLDVCRGIGYLTSPYVTEQQTQMSRAQPALAISDVIAGAGMDDETRADVAQWTGCIAGALSESDYRAALNGAGVEQVEVTETHRVHQSAGAPIIRARRRPS